MLGLNSEGTEVGLDCGDNHFPRSPGRCTRHRSSRMEASSLGVRNAGAIVAPEMRILYLLGLVAVGSYSQSRSARALAIFDTHSSGDYRCNRR